MTSPQQPIGSGFGLRTDARDALGGRRLDGKVAIVTGGYSGLGLETTRALAEAGARVVSLSSIGHRRAPVNFEDPNFERGPYDKWEAYGRAKSANALFAVGLDKRGESHGVRAFAVHPGGIMTDLQRFMPEEEKRAMGWIDEQGRVHERFKTPSQGAATSVWCAANARLDGMGGVYCEDCDIAPAVAADAAVWNGVRPWAIDPALADQLWTLSENMTGLRFAPA